MRLLVVDDNDEKRAHVVQVLGERIKAQALSISEAKDYEEATAALSKNYFDLVILDLLLPGAGRDPSEETARALIRQLLAGNNLVPPAHVIGLTAFPTIGQQEMAYYQSNLFGLEFYNRDDTSWGERIANRVTYLSRSQRASMLLQSQTFDLDVFVLAARYENEYQPIKQSLFHTIEMESHPLWKDKITLGALDIGGGRRLSVGLGCVAEMGMAPTAAMASLAISVFRPKLLGMIGMCCGFAGEECASPRKMLDVIVARQVACWEEGKYIEGEADDEFLNRAKPRAVDDKIRDQVDATIEMAVETLMPTLRKISKRKSYLDVRAQVGEDRSRALPDVRYATMVSGSSVIADEAMIRQIIGRHPSAIGLDMELYGLYVAAERCIGARPSVLGIKGVADFGEAQKNDLAQKEASKVATDIFKGIVRNLDIFDPLTS